VQSPGVIDTEVAIIGGGVVGLACAALVAERGLGVVLLERGEGLARETSARNSGVVHAGLYYAPGSLKAQTCVEGRELLYARCAREGIAHRKTGKLVVATDDAERAVLEQLRERGIANGAGALELVDAAEVARREPRVRAVCGLVSPESGIVDAHGLAQSYAAQARAHGAMIVCKTALVGLDRARGVWSLSTIGPDGPFTITARALINAAGLECDRVARMCGLDVDALGWRLRLCKGDYFAIAPTLGAVTRALVYPVPRHAGLGVHVTMDLGGAYYAGPDAEYVSAPAYDVAEQKAAAFAAALERYLPEIRASHLTPGYAGIRPKLYGPGEPVRDFVLEERPERAIHLIGIESPGLTASEALARRVLAMISP
jgi:L-2-hydroxyglutarate oxidase LhgO